MGSMTSAIVLTPLARIPVAGGEVLHGLKATEPEFRGFGEAYFSTIESGAVKPWRMHQEMTVNLIVPVGKIRFVFFGSDGGESDAHHPPTVHEIGDGNYARLTVPPGIWFAFQGRAPGTSVLLNIADRPHDPAEALRRDLSAFDFDWS